MRKKNRRQSSLVHIYVSLVQAFRSPSPLWILALGLVSFLRCQLNTDVKFQFGCGVHYEGVVV